MPDGPVNRKKMPRPSSGHTARLRPRCPAPARWPTRPGRSQVAQVRPGVPRGLAAARGPSSGQVARLRPGGPPTSFQGRASGRFTAGLSSRSHHPDTSLHTRMSRLENMNYKSVFSFALTQHWVFGIPQGLQKAASFLRARQATRPAGHAGRGEAAARGMLDGHPDRAVPLQSRSASRGGRRVDSAAFALPFL